MSLDWSEINKTLCEHWGIGPVRIPYNPERLNYADFLKTEEGRQEMTAYADYEFSHRGTETGRITEAEYERRKAMSKDLFTKNETDIALLRRCIDEKWLPIYEGKKKDRGGVNCPLCAKYGFTCIECPIREDTGHNQCHGTPYENHWKKVAEIYDIADTPEKKLAALQEIVYLEELIIKLIKIGEAEKEKQAEADQAYAEAKAAAEKARIEKEKKVYYPHVFYISLEEPAKDFNFRLDLRDKMEELLRKEGLKVMNVRYTFQGRNHLVFSKKTGYWKDGNNSPVCE